MKRVFLSMSVIDSCEPSVIRAFEKDGWRLLSKPFSLNMGGRRLVYADFSIERGVNGSSEQFLVVEVQCFTRPEDDQVELYRAVGQYLFYRTLMVEADIPASLLMVLPINAHLRLQSIRGVTSMLGSAGVKMVIVDLEREEIAQWIH
jgi:hypothetical protein